jgi:2-C-methyl-D-erythritol 2,4-cyclodiphosphate synthase
MDDIGTHFPSGDERWRGARSLDLLAEVWCRVAASGWSVVNVDAFVVLQAPQLAPFRNEMRARVAEALQCDGGRVSVRATGTDGLGFTGRGEGAACQAVALLRASS